MTIIVRCSLALASTLAAGDDAHLVKQVEPAALKPLSAVRIMSRCSAIVVREPTSNCVSTATSIGLTTRARRSPCG